MIGDVSAAVILLDPGHGGEDFGAKVETKATKTTPGQTIYEKDLTLQVALRIRDELKKLGQQVFLTRSMDRKLSLPERAELADKVQADIFISVHMNSYFHGRSRGLETYYLDNHHDAAIRKVEQAENMVDPAADVVVQKILLDLIIERTVDTSKKLGHMVHQSIMQRLGPKYKVIDRGLRPGLFYVLALAKRPALLLEMGFLSNPKDLNMLLSEEFQEQYAQAIAAGIMQYLTALKTGRSTGKAK
ncbi:MAG: N-acetylmuramoyl-L-alanine amidase [Bacteriovoracaceae bacterium]|nr:N-acetylmuramoyl-L-alanine amidase [Bacteriovoracaceae bacterium]